MGYAERTEFVRGSVTDLPAAWTNRFDFVCSNGVVHHTPDLIEDRNLRYLVRKPS